MEFADFKTRFAAAKAHRRDAGFEQYAREVYKFCFNGREAEWDDGVRAAEPEEIFTDFPATVAEEFHGELFSTMTPENQPWVGYEAGNKVEQDDLDDVTAEIEGFEKGISGALRASNYYTEGQTAFQDAVVGTVALWVDRPYLSAPINTRAIPISKLYLRAGARGVEDRFYRERYAVADLPILLPDASFPRDIADRIKKGTGTSEVIWGFWRDYSDPAAPVWQQAIRVDRQFVGMDVVLGPEGSCPLTVGRFNPIPGHAWGRGPGLRLLPSLRTLNELNRMNLEGMDRTLDPAWVYPHDGMLDLSDGIENGTAYPAMPGSAENIRPIGVPGTLDYGFYSEERLQDQIKTGFYRDPVQRGKTPPSASQYLGEDQKITRRMARPAAPLWREFGVGLLSRVEYLERQAGGSLERAGSIPLIESGAIMVRPISPLERSQAREDVLVAQQIMAMAQDGLGPDQAALVIDGPASMLAIKERLNDRLLQFRTQDQITQIMKAMQANAQPAA